MTEAEIQEYLMNSGKFIDPAKWLILMFKEIYQKGYDAGKSDTYEGGV